MNTINYYKEGNASWIGLVVPIGSRIEDNDTKGKAHFLEHMSFKGTKNRTKDQIKRELEQYGATLNAYTGVEATCYWALINSKYIKVAEEVLEDMVFNSLIPEDEFEKEKQVILQELKMYDDNPQLHIWDIANKVLFAENSGLYLPEGGTLNSVKNIQRKDLLNFYKKYYTKNILKVKVGNVSAEQNEIETIPLYSSNYKEWIAYKDYNVHDRVIFEKRQDVSQANILLCGICDLSAFNAYSKVDTCFLFEIFRSLFNGFTGRLFGTIREKHNLVYSVYFYHKQLSDNTVVWYVYAGLNYDKIPEAEKLIVQELTRPISKKELDFAVEKRIGQLKLTYDSTENIGDSIVHSFIKGIPYTKIIKDYESNLYRARSMINSAQITMNFADNITVGIVPK